MLSSESSWIFDEQRRDILIYLAQNRLPLHTHTFFTLTSRFDLCGIVSRLILSHAPRLYPHTGTKLPSATKSPASLRRKCFHKRRCQKRTKYDQSPFCSCRSSTCSMRDGNIAQRKVQHYDDLSSATFEEECHDDGEGHGTLVAACAMVEIRGHG